MGGGVGGLGLDGSDCGDDDDECFGFFSFVFVFFHASLDAGGA